MQRHQGPDGKPPGPCAFCRPGIRLLGLLLLCFEAQAALLPPRAESVDSALLHERRDIEVYLPEEAAADPTARFETLYVLDGDWNAKVVTDTVNFMRQVGFLPPLIVVSVKNHLDAAGRNTRDRDLTPTQTANDAGSGGAHEFLRFLKQELVPYVDAHFPTNGLKSIHGHSYGGLFLLYVLTEDPGAFDGYIILDPSLWWDHHALDKSIEARLPSLPVRGKAIYMAGREGAAAQSMGFSALEPWFRELAPAQLHWNARLYRQETHDSLKLKGTYDGLKFIFNGYTQDAMDFMPSSGTLIRGKPLPLYLRNAADRFDIRYSTDGSTPDENSKHFTDHILIDDATTRIRLLSARGEFDRDLPHHLVNGAALPPASTKPVTEKQWRFVAYRAAAWPKLQRAQPFNSQSAAGIGRLKPLAGEDFAAAAQRRLGVEEAGYYVFHLRLSVEARLLIAGRELARVDKGDPHEQSIVVPLKRGSYPVRFEYRHPDNRARVAFEVYRLSDDDSAWWREQPVLDLAAGQP